MKTSASSSWCIHNCRSLAGPGISSCRRNQISEVVHGVLITAPGGLPAPKPPSDSFHAESSNPGLDQLPSGLSVVKRHSAAERSAAGTTVIILGGFGMGAQLAALVKSC